MSTNTHTAIVEARVNSQQLSLFDVARRPPVRTRVDPDGQVLQTEPYKTFRLKHPRLAWDRARIEIHQHEGGLWMWATGWNADNSGGGYRVGAKWGKFADTREDALFYACEEIESYISEKAGPDAALVLKWTATLKENPEAFK